MIPTAVPDTQSGLLGFLLEIARRAIDGTTLPLFVDNSNQRVLIGATSATTTNTGKLEVTGGDVKVVDNGKGIILHDSNGVAYRLYIETDGAISAIPI